MPPVNGDRAVPSSSQQPDLAAITNIKRNMPRPRYPQFAQQKLPHCQLIITPRIAIPAIALVGIVFIPIGLACMAASNKVVEVVDEYETACIPEKMRDNKVAYIQDPSTVKSCLRLLKIHAHMKAPIYVYYKLDKFHQNHRRYARSRSISQLGSPKMAKNTKTCGPEATANGGGPIVPCGLVAWSLFNDTYAFARRNETLAVNRQGISWGSDRGHLFGDRVFPRNFQAGDLVGGGKLDPNKPLSEQEDLMVWMRTAALPAFRKLYGRIEVDLHAGDRIAVTVENNYNTYSFGGRKALVLSTAGVLGGRSSFLGRAYLAGGAACLALALLLTLLFLLPAVRAHEQ